MFCRLVAEKKQVQTEPISSPQTLVLQIELLCGSAGVHHAIAIYFENICATSVCHFACGLKKTTCIALMIGVRDFVSLTVPNAT